jgi:hypothetical protein
MKRKNWHYLIAMATLALVALMSHPARAVKLFNSSDTALGIDVDVVPDSSYPGGEAPGKGVDQVVLPSTTKYLNFGGPRTGFIVTPAAGSSLVKSLQMRAANDDPNRDPMSYDLYGTNDPITSPDNSFGNLENWTLISSGASGIETDPGRNALGVVQDFGANSAAYTSYKVVFPTLRNFVATNSMQVSDVALFTEVGGGGTQVLAAGDPTLAIDDFGSQSRYPGGEAPSFVLDGSVDTKYLNFGGVNTGLIVGRSDGKSTIVKSLTFSTANDAEGRDPLTWQLFGTNDPITSSTNSLGNSENWTLVDAGATGFDVDPGRKIVGTPVGVNNTSAFGAYRLVFSSLRDPNTIMQIADVNFDGVIVPEPATTSLVVLGCLLVFGRRKK